MRSKRINIAFYYLKREKNNKVDRIKGFLMNIFRRLTKNNQTTILKKLTAR